MSFRIKTVAELTGIPRNTLVAWERRYGVIKPRRSDNRYRVYSEDDVATLIELKTLVGQGHPISEAIELLQRGDAAAATGMARGSPAHGLQSVATELQEHLLGFDRASADRVRARLATVPFRRLMQEVFTPLVTAIGVGWTRGEVTIAQEHFATAWVRDQLVSMLLQLECGPRAGQLVACATPPGERHELGLLGLAVELALTGRRVSYLGVELPLEAIAAYAASERPVLICLSVVQARDASWLEDLARTLRLSLPPETQLAIGGPGVPAGVDLAVPGVWCSRDHADLDPGAFEPGGHQPARCGLDKQETEVELGG